MADITPDVLQLLTDKSCTYNHSMSYTKDVNSALATSAQRGIQEYSSMDILSQAKYRLQHHETFHDIEPSTPVGANQQIPTRVEFLYTYLKNYLQSYMTDLNFTPDTQLRGYRQYPDKPGAGAMVKKYTYNIDHEGYEDIYNGDGEGDEYEEHVFYSSTNRKLPKGFLEHDAVLALNENQECANDPNKKTLMRPCPCNLGQAHTTKCGSMRFCKNFLNIQSLKD